MSRLVAVIGQLPAARYLRSSLANRHLALPIIVGWVWGGECNTDALSRQGTMLSFDKLNIKPKLLCSIPNKELIAVVGDSK